MPYAPSPAAADPASPALQALRARIGWLCHTLRIATPLYAAWVFVQIVQHWSDTDHLRRFYGGMLGITIVDIAPWQQLSGFAVHFLVWLPLAATALAVWRLFTGFLEGRVFTPDAAATLRCVAVWGMGAELADLLSRPALSALATLGNAPHGRALAVFFSPQDLLNVIFLAGFLALAHVFKVAADIADENSSFV
ncbi:DUF2975 domain-containing protein [Methyloraptor flagellatus]|uniref:DUF2975 domain-containing protein n=1 Tax=Methyloraptor flagellatus TaxID=3162530 RepID=A0AAU7XC75_9HYPH